MEPAMEKKNGENPHSSQTCQKTWCEHVVNNANVDHYNANVPRNIKAQPNATSNLNVIASNKMVCDGFELNYIGRNESNGRR